MADAVRAGVMLMSPDEFLVHPLSDVKAELVRGELRVTPPAAGQHGCVGTNLVVLLHAYLKGRGLGRVFGDGAATSWSNSRAPFARPTPRSCAPTDCRKKASAPVF